MCRRTTCKTCGKASWAGCGQHIEQALAGVPRSERCAGHEGEPRRSIFSRLFGKR